MHNAATCLLLYLKSVDAVYWSLDLLLKKKGDLMLCSSLYFIYMFHFIHDIDKTLDYVRNLEHKNQKETWVDYHLDFI